MGPEDGSHILDLTHGGNFKFHFLKEVDGVCYGKWSALTARVHTTGKTLSAVNYQEWTVENGKVKKIKNTLQSPEAWDAAFTA